MTIVPFLMLQRQRKFSSILARQTLLLQVIAGMQFQSVLTPWRLSTSQKHSMILKSLLRLLTLRVIRADTLSSEQSDLLMMKREQRSVMMKLQRQLEKQSTQCRGSSVNSTRIVKPTVLNLRKMTKNLQKATEKRIHIFLIHSLKTSMHL